MLMRTGPAQTLAHCYGAFMIEPEQCRSMAEVRAGVDQLDAELVTLLARRFRFMDAAARIKLSRDDVRDEARKAEVIERLYKPLTSATSSYPWPHVIRLVTYVRVPRAVQRKISRRALFARDGWRCVYCGTSSGRLTLDHVVPRSRGGDSVWDGS